MPRNPFDNRQPQSAAGNFLAGRTEETLAQMPDCFIVNRHAGINYCQRIRRNQNFYRGAFRTVLQGVVQQISQQQCPQQRIAALNRSRFADFNGNVDFFAAIAAA